MEMVGQMSLSCISKQRDWEWLQCNLTKYQLVIVPQNFSSHRWKSTKYPHDLWNRSKSHQIQKKIPVLYWPTGFPTWFHPCHGLSGDSLCHFESQQTFRNAAEGGSRWGGSGFLQPTAGPKKPVPGKDQCCFCAIVQDLVIEDFVCCLGCRFCWYYCCCKAAWA